MINLATTLDTFIPKNNNKDHNNNNNNNNNNKDQKIKLNKKRKLIQCPVCGKMGYQHIRWRGKHQYIYTKHSNEPPIGTYSNNQPKYKECYDSGRLYNSFEEFTQKTSKPIKPSKPIKLKPVKKLEPESEPKLESKLEAKLESELKVEIKTHKKYGPHNPKIIVCPKCGLAGRVNKHQYPAHLQFDKEGLRYYIEHGEIGGTWGKKIKSKKRLRHYMTGKKLHKATVNLIKAINN